MTEKQEHIAKLKQRLHELPSETTRAYETELTSLVMKEEPEFPDKVSTILDLLEQETEEPIRYACFVMATIWYRRNKDSLSFENLIRKYRTTFSNHPSFEHFRLLYYVDYVAVADTDWEVIAAAAQKNADTMNHCGARHMFAEFVAMFLENDALHISEDKRQYWLKLAIANVEQAITLDSQYAKFYCTKGRLYGLMGRYDDALTYVRYAIQIEPPGSSDYAIRIGNYQAHVLRIQEMKNLTDMRQQMAQYRIEQEELLSQLQDETNEVKGSLMRNLEYLGVFSGIISFTMGSVSLAGSVGNGSLIGAAALIVVLFGALIGVYGMFDLIIHGYCPKKKIQYWITLCIVCVSVGGGFALCLLI